MRDVSSFNAEWEFHEGFEPSLLEGLKHGVTVQLPHSAVEIPYNYFEDSVFHHEFCYQKMLDWRPEFEGRKVALIFDGSMADTVVYINGVRAVAHLDGYTPFEVSLTKMLKPGANLVTVKINGSENPAIPPFGGEIDYLTYAGIYRDVWLKITDAVSIGRIKIETPDALAAEKSVVVACEIRNVDEVEDECVVSVILYDANDNEIARAESRLQDCHARLKIGGLKQIELWDVDSPVLYRADVHLENAGNHDSVSTWFGFRTAEFTPDGFRLNGRRLKIRGLNRHQSFPYVGYAMGRRPQERDAEILKFDLGCNLARTSHYPQSPWFLDHCDRIGLLVFEEIPGWQHIGGDEWKRETVRNVRRMIQRDWNHPSIVLWGVRINESADCHDLYLETNSLARSLDPTRQTAGVRNIANSEMLEDVYTMNDFILGRETLPFTNRDRTPLRQQSEVTSLNRSVPYMVTEFNGHMHPTKSTDSEERQVEHVRRYLEVLNAANGDGNIAGCIGWCMFDYNTHKDFGSGDRICHHGVLDMFREPKFAAYVYASQRDPADGIILKPVTFWAAGERGIGGVLPLIILTNCDFVEIRTGRLSVRGEPDRNSYPHLDYPPVVIGHDQLSQGDFHTWGRTWNDVTVSGFVGGKLVKQVDMACSPVPSKLDVCPDSSELIGAEKDAVRVAIRALDQKGSILAHLSEPVKVIVEGPARLIGPSEFSLRGGVGGFWLESVGACGLVRVVVSSPRFQAVQFRMNAVRELP